MGTLDAHLVAFDRMTGAVAWDVEVADPTYGYSITHAPLVVDDMVIIGVSGGEYGIRGHVTAYDAASGKQVWRWYSIPAPRGDPTFDAAAPNGWWGTWTPTTPDGANLNRNIAQEKADSAKYADAWTRGGGGVWTTPAYDPETGLLYVTVGNPSPDLDGAIRPGDTCTPMRSCAQREDRPDGLVLPDGAARRSIWTQLPRRDHEAGRTEGGGAACGQDGVAVCSMPRPANWSGAPTTSRRRRTCSRSRLRKAPGCFRELMAGRSGRPSRWIRPELRVRGRAPSADALQDALRALGTGPPLARLRFRGDPRRGAVRLFSAINLSTGKIVWQNKVPQPMMGGSLATAGGLVFTGEGNGNFNAYDSKTGKLLWQFNGGAGCNSAPMTFEWNGEQFIAVACGGNFQLSYPLGNSVYVFGLPKEGALAGRDAPVELMVQYLERP
jgi:hypothetical protein